MMNEALKDIMTELNLDPVEEQEALPELAKPVSLTSLQVPPESSGNELIKHRFLCKGGSAQVSASAGLGKTTFAIMLAIFWSLGRGIFGLIPARPLSIWIIQTENDDGDLAEMYKGVIAGSVQEGMLTAEEAHFGAGKVKIITESSLYGMPFCEGLDRLLKQTPDQEKPDILFIDSILAYIEGDASSQTDMSRFLRRGLNPVMLKYGVALVAIHHTTKASKQNGGVYSGMGSSEWANFFRAVMTLTPLRQQGLYRLCAPKRGGRLQWKDANGAPTLSRCIAHGRNNLVYWRDVDASEAVEASSGSAAEPVMPLTPSDIAETAVSLLESAEGNVMPKAELEAALKGKLAIGRDKAKKGVATALKSGRLFEGKVKCSKVIGLDKAAVDAAVADGDRPQGETQSAPASSPSAQASLEVQP